MTRAAAFWLCFRPADGWPWAFGGPYATPFEAGRDGATFVADLHPVEQYGERVQLRLLGVDRTGEWCRVSGRDEDVFSCGWDRATTTDFWHPSPTQALLMVRAEDFEDASHALSELILAGIRDGNDGLLPDAETEQARHDLSAAIRAQEQAVAERAEIETAYRERRKERNALHAEVVLANEKLAGKTEVLTFDRKAEPVNGAERAEEITRRHESGESLTSIAESLGISRPRASQIYHAEKELEAV